MIGIELLQYQRQGLSWLIKRDQDRDVPGGLLCDQQGLGKTLQALSLIASSPELPSHGALLPRPEQVLCGRQFS